jgi:RNA 3'-terminal phosphate cyclase (ATP)
VEGAALGSRELRFSPEEVKPGTYLFDVGTAGSVALVLQTLALPLALASGPSKVAIAGGTDVRWAPTIGYIQRAYLSFLGRMGCDMGLEVARRGFYPKGGGEVVVALPGSGRLEPMALDARGELEQFNIGIDFAQLPGHVHQRAGEKCKAMLEEHGRVAVETVDWTGRSPGPGVAVCATAAFSGSVLASSAVGERGLPSERLAAQACDELLADFMSGATADIHMADQLLLPMSLAPPGSSFLAREVTAHARTNIAVIERFLGKRFEVENRGRLWRVARA